MSQRCIKLVVGSYDDNDDFYHNGNDSFANDDYNEMKEVPIG